MTDMQPGVSPIQGGVEQLPSSSAQNAGAPERMPMLPAPEVTSPARPETGIETGAERREQAAELQAAQADASAVATPVVAVPDATVAPVQTAVPVVADTPLTAANDDVIEKEWVDKAKQIITTTKDDPFKRGQQVGELQRDYIKKRYGKDIGASPAA